MALHTLRAFAGSARIAGTLLVVSEGDDFWRDRPEAADARVSVESCGGATRAQSVRNGLQSLLGRGVAPSDWVLVHDAARCLVTTAMIDQLIDACLDDPVGGLLALRLPDTLKASRDSRVVATVERSDKWLAQTPQMFRLGPLAQALERAGDAVTDESSAMEAMGLQPLLVDGSAQNFKVTYPQDFALAEAVLRTRGIAAPDTGPAARARATAPASLSHPEKHP